MEEIRKELSEKRIHKLRTEIELYKNKITTNELRIKIELLQQKLYEHHKTCKECREHNCRDYCDYK